MKALIIFLFLSTSASAQFIVDFDSVEVVTSTGDTIYDKLESNFVYYPGGFVLVSSEKVYTFLLPGTEFEEKKSVVFEDMGETIKLDTLDTISSVLYQSTIRPFQVAQQVDWHGITLIKRDRSRIKFYARKD
jgi:hypothetical protein